MKNMMWSKKGFFLISAIVINTWLVIKKYVTQSNSINKVSSNIFMDCFSNQILLYLISADLNCIFLDAVTLSQQISFNLV